MNETFTYDGIEYLIEDDHKHIRRLSDSKKPNSQRFVAISYLKQNNVTVDADSETTHSAVMKIHKFLSNAKMAQATITPIKSIEKPKKEKNAILINNLFTGRYISKMENIGHEFINIYRSDNDNFYIYANPYGNINKEWDNRIQYVIFVRSVLKKKKLQVVGYAEIEKQILLDAIHSKKNASKKSREKRQAHYDNQLKYIKENQITYGGVLLYDIFRENSDDIDLPYFVTFKASNVYKASKEIILPEDNEGEMISRTSESMRIYVSRDNKYNSHYDNYIEMIQDKSNWNKVNEVVSITKSTIPSILTIARKNYDENVISNFFAFVIENDNRFWYDFTKEVLELEIKEKPHFIGRETENRIDLFIHVENKIIVIENKVKSAINGIDKEDKKLSQLSKYYDYTLKRAKELNIDVSECHFYVLRPNYNREDIERYNRGKYYRVIKYSEINDLLNRNNYSLDCIEEFKSIVSIHSGDFDNEIFDKQKDLLMNQIRKSHR